ncbi:hypothetical protein TNCV_1217091 [Trichonephila clavipes]|nr:hypothetical protein TNCV_1217091 [Trichonephila clavipes]
MFIRGRGSRVVLVSERGLLCHGIAARVGRDPVTAEYGIDGFRIVIRNAMLDLNGPLAPEDKHVTRLALMDRSAMSRALGQESGSFARQVSARTVQRCLLQHGCSYP